MGLNHEQIMYLALGHMAVTEYIYPTENSPLNHYIPTKWHSFCQINTSAIVLISLEVITTTSGFMS